MTVELRLVFLKIGEIDTLKEQFQAEAFIQARWSEPTLKGTVGRSSSSENRLFVSFGAGNRLFRPEQVLESALVHRQFRWRPEKRRLAQSRVRRHRHADDLRDAQSERRFPGKSRAERFSRRCAGRTASELVSRLLNRLVSKDLTITISTTRTVNEVLLVPDASQLSAINTRESNARPSSSSRSNSIGVFRRVYRSAGVASARTRRNVDEIDFQSFYPLTEPTSGLFRHLFVETRTNDEEKHFRSFDRLGHAARRPGYFYWNVYFLIVNLPHRRSLLFSLSLFDSSSSP